MAKNTSFDYFVFFTEMLDCSIRCVTQLKQILGNYQYSKIIQYKEELHKIEHEADLKKHEMMEHLTKEFLPPIDREDIIGIAHLLDEICDNAEEVVLLMYMEDIKTCRADAVKFTDIILSQCEELKNFFETYRTNKKSQALEASIIKVNTAEEAGDKLYFDVMRKLHTDGTDMLSLVCWRDIYNCLESCCDVCEKTADAAEEVLMKN